MRPTVLLQSSLSLPRPKPLPCPDCGGPLAVQSGCVTCPRCGWAKCG
jgi:hypothetical protein